MINKFLFRFICILGEFPLGPHRKISSKKIQLQLQAAASGNIYKCLNDCGRSYTLLSSLQRHMRLECGVPKKFWCPVCLKTYTRKDSLKYHMIDKHGMRSPSDGPNGDNVLTNADQTSSTTAEEINHNNKYSV